MMDIVILLYSRYSQQRVCRISIFLGLDAVSKAKEASADCGSWLGHFGGILMCCAPEVLGCQKLARTCISLRNSNESWERAVDLIGHRNSGKGMVVFGCCSWPSLSTDQNAFSMTTPLYMYNKKYWPTPLSGTVSHILSFNLCYHFFSI